MDREASRGGDVQAALDAAVQELQAKVPALNQRAADGIERAESALRELRKTLDGETAQLMAEAQARLEAVRDALSTSGDGAAARAEALEAELAQRELALAEAGEARALAESRAESMTGRLKDLESQLSAAEARVEALESGAAEKDAELASRLAFLEEENAGLRARFEDAESALSALREAETTHAGALTAAERARDAAISEAEALRSAAAKGLDAEGAEALRAELAAAREARERIESELAAEKSKGAKSALAQQLADALREAEEAQQVIRGLQAQLEQEDTARAPEPPPRTETPAATPPGVSFSMVEQAMSRLRDGKKRSIGEILLEANVLTETQLEEALDEQRQQPNRHLGAILIEKGYADEEIVGQVLACQVDTEFVHLTRAHVEEDAASLINGRLAQQHTCIPLRAGETTVTVAMTNPLDLVAIEDLERATGRGVEVVVGTARDINALIESAYANDQPG